MEATPIDPRVRRTRRLLQETVLELAAEQDFGSITVSDIATRAEVNRNTFYLHYKDKDDLVAQALDMLFEEFTAQDRAFADTHPQLTPEVVPPPLIELFRHINNRPELFRRLLGESGSSAFAARLRRFHEHQFLLIWDDLGLTASPGTAPPELRARVAAMAVKGVIGWWLDQGREESVETMAAWLWQMARSLWFEDNRRN